MITKKTVSKQIDDLSSLKILVQTYEEIAASRIRLVRESVLKSRYFVDELNVVFSHVKNSYKKEVAILIKKNKSKNKDKFSFIVRNGKTLNLLISANTGLYGNIINETFDLFLKETKDKNCEVAIIGRQGLNLFLSKKLENKYKYFDFPDNTVNKEKLIEIINYILKYEKIIIFYGKFHTIFTQKSAMNDISGNIEPDASDKTPVKKYFFEPNLEKILSFFEQEIFASIFEQTIKESQLAKFGSRLVALNTSNENIKNGLKDLAFQKSKINHQEQNRKQLQTLSGIIFWNK